METNIEKKNTPKTNGGVVDVHLWVRCVKANQLCGGEIFKTQKGDILIRLEYEGLALENINYKDVKGADIGNGKVHIMAWNESVMAGESIIRI